MNLHNELILNIMLVYEYHLAFVIPPIVPLRPTHMQKETSDENTEGAGNAQTATEI